MNIYEYIKKDNSNASNYILVPPSTVENNKISVQKDEMGYIEV